MGELLELLFGALAISIGDGIGDFSLTDALSIIGVAALYLLGGAFGLAAIFVLFIVVASSWEEGNKTPAFVAVGVLCLLAGGLAAWVYWADVSQWLYGYRWYILLLSFAAYVTWAVPGYMRCGEVMAAEREREQQATRQAGLLASVDRSNREARERWQAYRKALEDGETRAAEQERQQPKPGKQPKPNVQGKWTHKKLKGNGKPPDLLPQPPAPQPPACG